MCIRDRAAPAQQVAAELFDELLEARLALGAGRFLVRLGNRRTDGQEVAAEQRQCLDFDVLIALQSLELARQPVEPLGDGRLTLIARVRRQPGRQCRRDDRRLGHALLGGQFVQTLRVLG